MRASSPTVVGLCLVLSLAPSAGAIPPIEHSCHGVAPESTSCTTGEHVTVAPDLEVMAAADYSGRIVSRLTGEFGEIGRACSFIEGTPTACTDWGVGLLLPGMSASHECGSYDYRNATVPGGRGAFGCSVSGVL